MEAEKEAVVIAMSVAASFVIFFGLLLLTGLINYLHWNKRLLLEKQMRETRYAQGLLQAQLETQDNTLKAVSREIHDNIGQVLSLAKISLHILSLEKEDNEKLLSVKQLVGKAINDLRGLGACYSGECLAEEGLLSAIRHELNQLQRTGLFTIEYTSSAGMLVMEKSRAVFLYHIIREVFNDILNDSSADHISVRIFCEEGRANIMISYNGQDFSGQEAYVKQGTGLRNIEQRAALIGVSATISSEKDKGTLVHLIFRQDDQDSLGG